MDTATLAGLKPDISGLRGRVVTIGIYIFNFGVPPVNLQTSDIYSILKYIDKLTPKQKKVAYGYEKSRMGIVRDVHKELGDMMLSI